MEKNPFVFACITPHGLPIIETLAPTEPELMHSTRRSMQQLGAWMQEAHPETIIVLTPHGLSTTGHFTVVNTSFMSGEMSEQTLAAMSHETRADKGNTVSMTRTVDRALAREIISAAESRSLPVVSAGFATSEGPFSNLPLDWGVMIPLYFMPKTPIVVISPSRQLSYADHIEFGRAIADAVQKSGKRVGLIASCDWAHAHNPDGPYGFHEDAARLDEQVAASLKTNDIEAMMDFSDEFIQNAKPDGIWQSLILAGAIPKEARKATFLSYEAPTYFGLMCVSYEAS